MRLSIEVDPSAEEESHTYWPLLLFLPLIFIGGGPGKSAPRPQALGINTDVPILNLSLPVTWGISK